MIDLPDNQPMYTSESKSKFQQAKITASLETEYGKVEIAVSRIDLSISDLFEELILPLLIASGFSQESIDKYLER